MPSGSLPVTAHKFVTVKSYSSVSSWPLQLLPSLVLNCWCASHWLLIFEMKIKTKLKIPWSSHATSWCFHLLPLIVIGLGRLPFPAPGSGPVHNSPWHVAHQITRLAFCRPQCGLEKVKVSGWKEKPRKSVLFPCRPSCVCSSGLMCARFVLTAKARENSVS